MRIIPNVPGFREMIKAAREAEEEQFREANELRMIAGDCYQPGDVIVKEGPTVITRVYVVDDPARTTHGKLRLRRETGTILTTWWGTGGNPYWLPKHYRRDFAGFPGD